MVNFAGWEMPVQYHAGIKSEHEQCRNRAAVFDVSHMGQVTLHGENAAKELEGLVPSNIEGLPEGKARYTFFTNEAGGILDDIIVSNAGDCLFVVVNASMRDQDIMHLQAKLSGVEVREIMDRALIAVQGPKAEEVVANFAPVARDLKFMETTTATILDSECRISRLGYTGEDGYEISMPSSASEEITRTILNHEECSPAGLGARDSLRMEAGLCLYGNELTPSTSPVEAQLTWAIQKRRREEGGFPGDERILGEMTQGTARKLVGIMPEGRAPAREGTEIADLDGKNIGSITSGGFGPTVNGPISIGYVPTSHSEPGTRLTLIVRGKAQPAKVSSLPFVKQNYKR